MNIVFFDQQFKFVSQNSEVVQVSTEGSGQTIYRVDGSAKEATKNGYVYIYVSNESNNLVYFACPESERFGNNLQSLSAMWRMTHEHGPLVEEDHYYPYGLGMAGISSKAMPSFVPNQYKANGGAEYGNEEWADGSGLEIYETFYRSYNAQIARFMQVDPMAESSVAEAGYSFGGNNPVMFTDLLGDQYSYMDKSGTRWHHQDILKGTANESQQYVEGYGFDGFGDESNNGKGSGDHGNRNRKGSSDYTSQWEYIIAGFNEGRSDSWDPQHGFYDKSQYPDGANWVRLAEVRVDFYFQPGWRKNGDPYSYRGGFVQNWTNNGGGKQAIFTPSNGSPSVIFPDVTITDFIVKKGTGYTTSNGGIHADKNFDLAHLQHEYGHYLQALHYSSLIYNLLIVPQSLASISIDSDNHNNFWTEKDASAWAAIFFGPDSQIAKDKVFPKELSFLIHSIYYKE